MDVRDRVHPLRRHGRFRESDLFRRVFETVLRRGIPDAAGRVYSIVQCCFRSKMRDVGAPRAKDILLFGPFTLSPAARLLTRDGKSLLIGGRIPRYLDKDRLIRVTTSSHWRSSDAG
jgi:hypothetical protein